MTDDLGRLAERYGVATSYIDQAGVRQHVAAASIRAVLGAIGVAAHSRAEILRGLQAAPSDRAPSRALPKGVRCYLPNWLENGRTWGIALQLYQLRSRRNWGIGDFEDLARFAEHAAALGADFVGLNPVHALFLAQPERCSPFSPSNRRFLNPLYIAVDRVPGFDAGLADERQIERLRQKPMVDYAAVCRVKLDVLRSLWTRWSAGAAAGATALHRRFAAFRESRGAALERHARFEALSERMQRRGHGPGWQSWPAAYRNPDGPKVHAFAAEYADDVSFQAWLQWLADAQLDAAKRRALAAGMRIGLYLDLAVGEVPDGSATWSDPDLVAAGAHIGAPPDAFNMDGQDWGLSPLSPAALRARGLAPYRELLNDALRHAGALRIDHAMALRRLYLVPVGRPPRLGTYVRFPMADMISALAAASKARQTVIIGEDLGTVPAGFRQVMARAEIQSYRLLYFERRSGTLRQPRTYPRHALACLSTHDLAPLLGWWHGDDIDRRAELGLSSDEFGQLQRDERRRDRLLLLRRLVAARLMSPAQAQAAAGPAPAADVAAALAAALHRYLASAPSRLFAVRLEDLAGERRPVNLPGVGAAYPNWRPRLSVTLEELPRTALFQAVTGAVAAARGRRP